MKQGRRPKDQAFIQEQYQLETAKLNELESKGDLYALWQELGRAVSDFDGVGDVTAWKKRAADLENNKAVKQGEKREKEEIRNQQVLAHEGYRDLQLISDEPSERAEALSRFRNTFGEMKKKVVAAREKGQDNSPEIVQIRRTLSQVLAQGIELGERAQRDKDYSTALVFYDLVIELARSAPLAHFERARTLALLGRNKDVLPELRKAMEKGFDASAVRDAPEFATFRSQPEFQEILRIVPPPETR
jgi:tetratricopeptide (TPR) repeat protein